MARQGRTKGELDEGQLLAVALGAARMGWGAMQILLPGLVDRLVVRPPVGVVGTKSSPSRVGWRMKGVRDLVVGAMGVVAPPSALTTAHRLGLVIDVGDTVSTALDRGRALRPAVAVCGTAAGAASVAIGVVAARKVVSPG